MRYIIFIFSCFYLMGCMGLSSKPKISKASLTNQEIVNTQLDAQLAQKEYIELQKLRAGK